MENDNLQSGKIDPSLAESWAAVAQPGSENTEKLFSEYLAETGAKRRILNCAIPLARARELTRFSLPSGVTVRDCLVSTITGNFPESLRGWTYRPKIRHVPQLPRLKALPSAYSNLAGLPWFSYGSPNRWLGINARFLRHHHDVWQALRPKALQGINTTLVLALPQLAFSLTPHIQLEQLPLFLFSLARGLYPAQLFPARYAYPDADLGTLADAPAPVFGDILPLTGGYSYPVVDAEPEPNRVLARFGRHTRYLGYPFTEVQDADQDLCLNNHERGAMLLPDGRLVRARSSQTTALATLDPELNQLLLLDRDEFAAATGLLRATSTHDGLPIVLPVEMRPLVFAVILTHWRLEMDHRSDLTSYTVRTKHAAISGFHFYQCVDPYYSQFMRLYHEICRERDFAAYLLTTHLNQAALGGNLRLSNRLSESERDHDPALLRAYHHQQLDWMMGMVSLCNHVNFRTRLTGTKGISRTGLEIEGELDFDGLAFHQMAGRLLRFDSHLFHKPRCGPSLWPNLHPGFMELDRQLRTESLPHV